jgi:DNA (cytosine-5)-methyltransferase 1
MENVRGHLSLGFGTVLGDLASLGYSAEWQVLPASAFGAPHRRERLFIVAYPDNAGERAPERDLERKRETDLTRRYDALDESGRRGQTLADTNDERCSTVFREVDCLSKSYQSSRRVSAQWQIEPDVGRVAHGISARTHRLRALGNGVVPQVAEWVGHRIMAHARSVS